MIMRCIQEAVQLLRGGQETETVSQNDLRDYLPRIINGDAAGTYKALAKPMQSDTEKTTDFWIDVTTASKRYTTGLYSTQAGGRRLGEEL